MKFFKFLPMIALAMLPTSAFCKGKGHLYDLKTGEVINIQFTRGLFSGHGKIWATYPTGEKLAGEYTVVTNSVSGWGSIYSNVYGSNGFASGSGYSSMSLRSNAQQGSAILTGDRKVVQCEFVNSAATLHGAGACKDQDGNLFRLIY